MGVQMATCGAVVTSGVTLLLSLAVIYYMHSEITSMWSELDAEIDKFKLLTNDSWKFMLMLGVGSPSNRLRRQYAGYGASGMTIENSEEYSTPKLGKKFLVIPLEPGKFLGASQNCICSPFSGCPPGPPGPPGKPGHDAPDGFPGVDGLDGMDNVNFMKNSDFVGCIYCPQGPPGVEGKTGPTGKRGIRGAKGAPGLPGRDGNPGMPGPQGLPGPQGPDGKQGRNGRKGEDSEQQISRRDIRLGVVIENNMSLSKMSNEEGPRQGAHTVFKSKDYSSFKSYND
uniref:Col_cuticle_N domain-containing protein n=1 Tax=Angiostrongylus cantonensis TaxID=6313 RepID=A0A0K0DIB2_ANGCA